MSVHHMSQAQNGGLQGYSYSATLIGSRMLEVKLGSRFLLFHRHWDDTLLRPPYSSVAWHSHSEAG